MTPADAVKCKHLRTLEIISKHVKFDKSRTLISIASTKQILLLFLEEYPLSNLESFWFLHFWILKSFKP